MMGRMSLVKVAGFWASALVAATAVPVTTALVAATAVPVTTVTARNRAGISPTDVWSARINTSP